MYTFDVFYRKEKDHGEEDDHVMMLSVNQNTNVQDLKTQILGCLSPSINRKNLRLKFYKSTASYEAGFGSRKCRPDAPSVILESDRGYEVEEVINKIPSTVNNNYIKLTPISPLKIVVFTF